MRFTVRTLAPILAGVALIAAWRRPAPDARAGGSFPQVVPNDNRVAAGRRVGDTLLVRLAATRAAWAPDGESAPGVTALAFTEEGSAPRIPGPLLRVRVGTPVRVAVRNPLADTLVVYGLASRSAPAADSLVVLPGDRGEARFVADRVGTFFYSAATSAARRRPVEQRPREHNQLVGALVVDPPGRTPPPADRVLVVTGYLDTLDANGRAVRDARNVIPGEHYTINGRSWPHTERLAHAVGDSIRWRVINASPAPHVLHLHGFYFRVDARGDNGADTLYAPGGRRMAVTEFIDLGKTMSLVWGPDRPGGWLFHCHMTPHIVREAAGRRGPGHGAAHGGEPDAHAVAGMRGLVLAVDVRDTARRAARTTTEPPAARRLRLFVNSDSAPGDAARRFGYVLQTGDAEPAPDSVPLPGPTLVLARGEPTAIEVINRTGEPTAVHWHGIELDSYFDGVTGVSGSPALRTPAIRHGESFEARITPRRAGTFMYHTHFDEMRQQYGGLVGAIVVLEPGERWNPARDLVFLVGDSRDGTRITINGSTSPPPVELRAGVTYRLRLANIAVDRPATRMRLVRDSVLVTWRVVAKDGWTLPPERATTRPSVQPIGSGETVDVEFTPDRPGPLMLQLHTGGGRLLVEAPLGVR